MSMHDAAQQDSLEIQYKVLCTSWSLNTRDCATLCRIPHCLDFHGAFMDADRIYLVMDFCACGDLLERLLVEKRAMSERRLALEVALPMLTALRELHALRIIHRWGGGSKDSKH